MSKKDFSIVITKKCSIARNVDIKRVRTKKRFYYSDHKKGTLGNFVRNFDCSQIMAKKRFFLSDHNKPEKLIVIFS